MATSQTDLRAIDVDLRSSLSKSFLTAVRLLGDASKAEELVLSVIESLDPQELTSRSVRNKLIKRLVEAQLGFSLS